MERSMVLGFFAIFLGTCLLRHKELVISAKGRLWLHRDHKKSKLFVFYYCCESPQWTLPFWQINFSQVWTLASTPPFCFCIWYILLVLALCRPWGHASEYNFIFHSAELVHESYIYFNSKKEDDFIDILNRLLYVLIVSTNESLFWDKYHPSFPFLAVLYYLIKVKLLLNVKNCGKKLHVGIVLITSMLLGINIVFPIKFMSTRYRSLTNKEISFGNKEGRELEQQNNDGA